MLRMWRPHVPEQVWSGVLVRVVVRVCSSVKRSELFLGILA